MSAASAGGALLVAAMAVGAVAGCPADPRDKEKTHVLVRVGDVEIKDARLISALAQRGTARIVDPGQREAVARVVLDEMIDEELLLLAASKSGIAVRDEEVEREVRNRAEDYPVGTFQRLLVAEQLTLPEFKEKVRRRLVQDAFLRARLAAAPPISEEDVRARFDATLKDKKVPEQVHARQILVKTSEEATHVLDQIRTRKIGFEAAAQKYSSAPDAEGGGDLGWFGKGDMPDAFDVCFNLEKGTVSDVVVSSYGFHIFQVLDRRDERAESFEGARERVEEELMRERQSAEADKLLAELRAETPVHVNAEVLARVIALLPPAPVEPSEQPPEDGTARALDSHGSAIDPVPPVPRPPEPRAPRAPAPAAEPSLEEGQP